MNRPPEGEEDRIEAMAKFEGMPRAYTRPEGEEEVTPPLDEPRFSAAAALLVQANRGGAPTPPLTLSESPESPSARAAAVDALLGRVEPAGPAPPDPDSPESPSAAAAAVLCGQLTQVHHTNSSDSLMGDDRAVNCLLALATDPSPKRPAMASWGGSRRRLKMRSAEPSPLGGGGAAERAADGGAFDALLPPTLLSGAPTGQLKRLAAAYKLCPTPSEAQLARVAARVGLAPEMAAQWFASRRVLEEWVRKDGINPDQLRAQFYAAAATPGR